ncbi:MAG: PAS domain S-box protein [Rhodocyclales bacterium]|nr:PAS domain S-box protein [Rhodocyclales bacterium]
MKGKSRLRWRATFLLMTLTVVVSAIAATAFTLWRLRGEAIDRHFDAAAMYARLFEDHLTQSLNVIDMTLVNIANGEATNEALTAALRQAPYLRSLALVGAGNRIAASSNPLNVDVGIPRDDFLPRTSAPIAVLRAGPPWVGRDFHGGRAASAAEPALPEAAGLLPVLRDVERGHNDWTTVLAAVNPDYFINHYSRSIDAAAGAVDLLRYDGVLLFSTDERERPGGPGRHEGIAGRIAQEEFGRAQEVHDGREVLIAYRASRSYPFIVVVRLDKEQGLAGWRREAKRTLAIVVAVMAAALALAGLYFVRLGRLARRQDAYEEKLRLAAKVFETRGEAIIVTDGARDILTVNQAFTAITGYTAAEVVGRNPRLLASGKHDQAFYAALWQSVGDTGRWEGEIVNRRKNGELYTQWLTISRVEDEDGAVTNYVAIAVDVSERRKSEAELRLRGAALEAADNAIIITDAQGGLEWANPAFCALTGYAMEEAVGRNLRDLIRSGTQTRDCYENLWRTINAGQVWRGECINRRKDGTLYHEDQTITPVPDEHGTIRHFIAVKQDISERKRNEKRMAELSQHLVVAQESARRRLSGELHDRTSPNLAAIVVNLDIIDSLLAAAPEPVLADRLADIRALLDDTAASIREVSADLRPPILDYAGLTEALTSYARQFSRRTGIAVHVDCAQFGARPKPELESVLFRIVQEALTNCAKHAHASAITVALREIAGAIRLDVSDDGVGFVPDMSGKITHTSGLGLLTMREMTEFSGGEFRLESRPGEGTRIQVLIRDGQP